VGERARGTSFRLCVRDGRVRVASGTGGRRLTVRYRGRRAGARGTHAAATRSRARAATPLAGPGRGARVSLDRGTGCARPYYLAAAASYFFYSFQ